MPSPFPGMDPYLEHPGRWPDVHHRMIALAGDLLSERLQPRYFTRIDERVYISDEYDPGRRVIVPDLAVVRGGGGRTTEAAGSTSAISEPVEITSLVEDEIHEARIELIDSADRTVVTVIEVLSPTNKVPGSRGRESYEQKRLDVMRSQSHFIEIDLLRGGEGFPPYEALPPHEYRVHLSRVQRRPRGLLWTIGIDQRLPSIPIPLRGDDPDARLDLQAVLQTVYDRAAYRLQIDYRAQPVPPLSPQRAHWADELLRSKGLR
jgi:hypothetical protein